MNGTFVLLVVLSQLPLELQGEPGWVPFAADRNRRDPRWDIPGGVEWEFVDPTDEIQSRVNLGIRVGYNEAIWADRERRPRDVAEALGVEFETATQDLLRKDSDFDVSCCVNVRLAGSVVSLPDDQMRYPVVFFGLDAAIDFLCSMHADPSLRNVTAYMVTTLSIVTGYGDEALGGGGPASCQRMAVFQDAPGTKYVHELGHLNEIQGHWDDTGLPPQDDPGTLPERVMYAGGPNSGGRDLDEVSAIECTYLERKVAVDSRQTGYADAGPGGESCRTRVGIIAEAGDRGGAAGGGGSGCSFALPGYIEASTLLALLAILPFIFRFRLMRPRWRVSAVVTVHPPMRRSRARPAFMG